MSKVYRGPSKDASYQVSIHLVKRFQRRGMFRNQPIRNKNCLWRPCLITDRNEMSILYRGPSIDTSYQVSVHLAKRFQKRFSKWVWRYQKGNQNPYIEEQQTQWPKEKVQKNKQRSTKHTYKSKDRVTRTPLKIGGELRYSRRPIRNKKCLWRRCL
jgi:hypothetical protein